jgi:hypothetical protein
LQRPRHDAGLEFGDLQAVAQHDRVAADQVEPGQVTVEIHAHARPVQARRHLLDVGRLARAVQALQHDAPVVHEAGQDGECDVGVEAVHRVDFGHVFVDLAERGRPQVGVDTEDFANRDEAVGAGVDWVCVQGGFSFSLSRSFRRSAAHDSDGGRIISTFRISIRSVPNFANCLAGHRRTSMAGGVCARFAARRCRSAPAAWAIRVRSRR